MSSVTTMSQFGTPAGASAAIMPRRNNSLITKCSPAAPVNVVALTITHPPNPSEPTLVRTRQFLKHRHTSSQHALIVITACQRAVQAQGGEGS